MIGYCGIDCEKCDAYLATINNDDELRKKTAKLWGELNNAPIEPEMINCTGCRTNGVKTIFCSELCEIRKCAIDKKFETCGKCPEMKSCANVGEVLKNNSEAAQNLQ